MRRVIAGAFTSLDGVMQAPGGPKEDTTGGFRYGGWIVPYQDPVVEAALDDEFGEAFDLLLGRRTYDIFAAYWPYVDTSTDNVDTRIARQFNAARKYVATHNPDTLTWENSRALGPDVLGAVRRLKEETGPNLLIQGSGVLLHQLMAAGLVDELRMFVFPTVLGKGKRLFDDASAASQFKLRKGAVSPKGVLIGTYERAGEVKTGSFLPDNPSEAERSRRQSLGA